ncbi:MAG: thiamine phosphate synthase [Brevinematales bacterium]|nr:thiamine phosphate synthase [Brevinematales bacterium]
MTEEINMKRLPAGLYAITCENRSRGRKNLEVVKEMLEAGIEVLQYREKENKTIREKYLECKEIAKMTKDYGVIFIVNDNVDIAMAVDADGVHIGQDDLPVSEVRKLVGSDKIIGLSTHNEKQANMALSEDIDYIGVGPIFKTDTKQTEPVGLGYLEYVVKNISLPFVAIGGIKEYNIDEVLLRGAKTVALVTEITESVDIKDKIKKLRKKLKDFKII